MTRTLFIGQGNSSVCWYRVVLPATKLGCDYVGVYDEPPNLVYATGLVGADSTMPKDFTDYRVVVIQQPKGRRWLSFIQGLQSEGVKVIFECDDWLHSIRRQKDHDFAEDFDAEALRGYEMCMRACDAMIVSTQFIKSQYLRFNKQIYVCENGVDVDRYDYRLPPRPGGAVYIGWAGATGHRDAVLPWLSVVARVMAQKSHVNFVSIGQPFAEGFHAHFPQDRAIAIPFCALEQYPAAMTAMDIAIGPAGTSGFFRGKSDLRWLEAGALGIPFVGSPLVYRRVQHGVDGFLAPSERELETILLDLVDNHDRRMVVGDNARRYVRRERSAEVTAQRWSEAIENVRSL